MSTPIASSPIVIHRGIIQHVENASKSIVASLNSSLSEEIELADIGFTSDESYDWITCVAGASIHKVIHTDFARPIYVLKPELAVDVTEAAGLIGSQGPVDVKILSRKFRRAELLRNTIPGYLVNAAFDALVNKPDISDADLLLHLRSVRPIALAALYDSNELDGVLVHVLDMVPRLRYQLTQWQSDQIFLEPVLLSKTYGLQGRADIVLRRPDLTEIIELKAGKPPSSGVRYDHVAQVAAYHMMLTEQHPDEHFTSKLWYVQDEHVPIRHALPLSEGFARLVAARNALVATDLAIAAGAVGVFRPLAKFRPESNKHVSSYDLNEISSLAHALDHLDTTERFAIAAWQRLVSGELLEQRTATSRSILSNLEFDRNASDTESMHLVFKRAKDLSDTSIRSGDAVLLSLRTDVRSSKMLSTHFKASVRGITASTVTISLRNKYAPVHDFPTGDWELEQDVIDVSSKAHYAGLRAFIDLPKERRIVLLGRAQPRLSVRKHSQAPGLTESQRTIVERALCAEELFLIQGPPGTGKTSAVLRAIVQELAADLNERVLVLAYTNRAANEICNALAAHQIPYVRHGSLEGATGERSIPVMARILQAHELAECISRSRCIVSTIQSLTSSPEIWEFGEFTTAIVDEASQILEPMLMLPMARVKRTILIGDHFQLPAVVAQPLDQCTTQNELLRAIHLTNTATSAFERLMRCPSMQSQTALLAQQGRMHNDIMSFPATAFYGGNLRCLHQDQTHTHATSWSHLLPHRSCFVDIANIDEQIHYAVGLATAIATFVTGTDHEPPIGIISPFRSVNNTITNLLPPDIRALCTVDTVERFQGSERRFIVYVAAVETRHDFDQMRSEIEYNGRFIDRKLNVAITRAKEQFVMIGNSEILRTSHVYAQAISSLYQHHPQL